MYGIEIQPLTWGSPTSSWRGLLTRLRLPTTSDVSRQCFRVKLDTKHTCIGIAGSRPLSQGASSHYVANTVLLGANATVVKSESRFSTSTAKIKLGGLFFLPIGS